MLRTIAGSLVGKDKHTVVVVDEENRIVKNLRILGDKVYVAKCVRDEDNGGIILTERSRSNCTFFLVLALGTKYVGDIKIMDQVSLPDDTLEAERSGFNKDEYVVPSAECQTAITPKE